jgi:lysophospholipase
MNSEANELETKTIKRMSFVETPNNRAPEGGTIHWIEGLDGASIRTACWHRPSSARGAIFILPGKAEYIEKYFEVIGELLVRGFNVVALDWRGQGLSTRQVDHPTKAYIACFEDFLDDFEAVYSFYTKDLPGPYVCLAHSMGGNIALRLVGEGRVGFSALVTTAPMTGLNMPSFWEKTAEAVAQTAVGFGAGEYFIPGASNYDPLVEDFGGNSVTRDPGRHARTAAIVRALPEIAQGGATYGWMHEAFGSIRKITDPDFGRQIQIPILILAAEKDRLVDPLTNRYVGVNIPGAEFHMIEDSLHEILMECDDTRKTFWDYFDGFLKRAKSETA